MFLCSPPTENDQGLLCAELSVNSFYSLLKDPSFRGPFSFKVRRVGAQGAKAGIRISKLVHPWPKAVEQSCLQMGTQEARGERTAEVQRARPPLLLWPTIWAMNWVVDAAAAASSSICHLSLRLWGNQAFGFVQDQLPRCQVALGLSLPCRT